MTRPDKRNMLIFNTKKYSKCYYDEETKVLYNMELQVVNNNAEKYLMGIGVINSIGVVLSYFEQENQP